MSFPKLLLRSVYGLLIAGAMTFGAATTASANHCMEGALIGFCTSAAQCQEDCEDQGGTLGQCTDGPDSGCCLCSG